MNAETRRTAFPEKSGRSREMLEFLNLGDIVSAAETQSNLSLKDRPTPWWLLKQQVDLNGNEFKGPIDPVIRLRGDVAQKDLNELAYPIIYSEDIEKEIMIIGGNSGAFPSKEKITMHIPIYREMVEAAIDVLEDIGVVLPKPTIGSGKFPWSLGHHPEKFEECETIFPDINVRFYRDYGSGPIENVALVVYRNK